jgi:hypothetical protein
MSPRPGGDVADIKQGRWTAQIEGDFVVLLIGARFNSKFQMAKSIADLGGRRGMQYMLKYLMQHPEKGLLHYESFGVTSFVQYWRSFEHLEAFATDQDDPHLQVWRDYWKRVGSSPRTGIWHETFLVRDGEYEAIYSNLPARGLGKAGELVKMGTESGGARTRLKARLRG